MKSDVHKYRDSCISASPVCLCSWHEMGTYDIPAEIDYILNSTGHNKLYYIGHSMGTTMFFVGMSQRPEYNHKISAMLAFAPVAAFTRTKNPVIHFLQAVMERLLEVNCC